MLAELLSSGLVIPQAYPSHCDLDVYLLVHVDLLPWCVSDRRVAAAPISYTLTNIRSDMSTAEYMVIRVVRWASNSRSIDDGGVSCTVGGG